MNNHRNNRLWLLVGVVLILLTLLLTVSACDGGLGVEGTVYEWVDAPAGNNGEIYVDKAAPAGRMIKPVASASVAFSFRTITTSENGTFERGWVVGPGRYMMDIKIEKEGYHTLKGEFNHDATAGQSHLFAIFLVRKET